MLVLLTNLAGGFSTRDVLGGLAGFLGWIPGGFIPGLFGPDSLGPEMGFRSHWFLGLFSYSVVGSF